ncbi:MAG TPA: SpoIIE family protein phosphatase [Pirellulales bacterium]|nr:SpoIIE family protein phosphatase [Pirellulales bacterium]
MIERTRAHILVVDDDAGTLRAVQRILSKLHRVTCVSSGAEALAQIGAGHLGAGHPDIAVVDIRMPEMNGFALTRELRSRAGDIDVILMTGDPEEPENALVRAIDEGAFYFIQKPFDRRVLLTLVARCLELRQLRAAQQRYVRQLEHELDEARRFQLSLLPPRRGEGPGVSLNARYVSCSQLAGDLYDYAAADAGCVAFLIADVVGHGVPAAMLTSVVKSAFRSAYTDGFEPLAVVDRVKDGIRSFDEDRFVTLCCGRLDAASGRLRYVNAGHPPPILRRDHDQVCALDSTGPMLSSAFIDVRYDEMVEQLSQSDSLLLYTDGVTETHGPDALFGAERLSSLVATSGLRGSGLLDAVLAALDDFAASRPQQDDVTLLNIDYHGMAD